MDNSLQKYYDDRFEMFGSKGWKDLIEDLNNMKKVTSDVNSCNDEKAFWLAKGELRLLNWFLNLEELTQEGYNSLKEE
jgi:hypothetical protein